MSTTLDTSALDDDQIVIGEAVALEIPPAHAGARLGGFLLDALIQIILLVGALYTAIKYVYQHYVDQSLTQAMVISIIVGIFVVWPVAWETLTQGRSIGKMAAGTRVVREDYGPITVRHTVTRHLIGWVEVWMTSGTVAGFTILANKRGKRLGDFLAGTQVVSERIPLKLQPPLSMPAPLGRWAAKADITSPSPALATTARQFLLRRNDLSPRARAKLATDIASRFRRHVSPPPPRCHPEDFIQAVLAERRTRDSRRLAANRQIRILLLGR